MTRLRGWSLHRTCTQATLALCVLAGKPAAQAQEPPFDILGPFDLLPLTEVHTDALSTLQPIVKRFDFDDLKTGPNSLPPNFYRYVAPSQGFPPFGEMRVVRGEGFVGSESDATLTGALEFDLKGGSMSARIGTSVIPVLPFADYIVACRVRTKDVHRAHARLAAWLCDSSGRIIEGSRIESRDSTDTDEWDTLSIEMHGRFAEAADLVFELQLVQPHLAPDDAEAAIDPQPQVPDISGRAWFDDVTVSHLPRVSLAMTQRNNIITQGEHALFAVQVNELASKQLTARLRIFDFDGLLVRDQSFPAPRGREPSVIDVPMDRCGWYRAVLDVASDSRIARRRWTDFVVLPEQRRTSEEAAPFGVTLASDAALADALFATRLRCGTVIVPAWDERSRLEELPQRASNRRAVIEQLLRSHTSIAFSLPALPEELARAAGTAGRSTLDVLCSDPARWRPYLDDLLMQFGLSINRWIIGDAGELAAAPEQSSLEAVDRATASLAQFVPQPQLHVAWPVAQEPESDGRPRHVALTVPASAPPDSITAFLQPWLTDATRSAIVSLDLLPASRYSPRQRLTDALQRGLHAWRAGSSATIIDQPWRGAADAAANALPDIVVAAWNTLNAQLAGRRFVSEIALGQDTHIWIAGGKDSTDALVIAWSDRDRSANPTAFDLQLGDRPLQSIDAFGNAATIVPRNGLHHIELGELPLFIPGVNLELMLFRSGLAIEPSFIPAASKVHEHFIVIRNPWDTSVAGTLRLTGDSEMQITPSVQEFAVSARGETRLPIQIIPQRGILAGPRAIPVEIAINADKPHTLKMDLNVEVGLKDIEVNIATSTSRNPITGIEDFIVSAAVTNRSDRPVNLDVDLLAENVAQTRRTIAALQPGQTQTRTFRIANGSAILAGKSIRLGVAQRDGVARLNRIITVGDDDRRSEFAGVPVSP